MFSLSVTMPFLFLILGISIALFSEPEGKTGKVVINEEMF
jgi:hypothetical protein